MQINLSPGTFFAEESQNFLGTQIELIKSGRLQGAALDRVGYVPKPDEDVPVQLEVNQPLKASILILRAKSSDPALAQEFLAALIDEYLNYKRETRLSTSEDVVLSLADELSKKGRDLQAQQDRWAEFQRTNNVAVLEEESRSAGLYLADLNLQLARLRLERELLLAGPPDGTAEEARLRVHAPGWIPSRPPPRLMPEREGTAIRRYCARPGSNWHWRERTWLPPYFPSSIQPTVVWESGSRAWNGRWRCSSANRRPSWGRPFSGSRNAWPQWSQPCRFGSAGCWTSTPGFRTASGC
jgi:hypothetical protein